VTGSEGDTRRRGAVVGTGRKGRHVMKQQLMAAVFAGGLMLSFAGAASADQALEPNPNAKSNSDNCIAVSSSQVRHNGSVVRTQDRQTEIKGLQDTCNNANDK